MAREIIAALISNSERLELVGEFPDAIEAMKYLNKNEVDLIFLDIHMPNFNGFDFIQTIKILLKLFYLLPMRILL